MSAHRTGVERRGHVLSLAGSAGPSDPWADRQAPGSPERRASTAERGAARRGRRARRRRAARERFSTERPVPLRCQELADRHAVSERPRGRAPIRDGWRPSAAHDRRSSARRERDRAHGGRAARASCAGVVDPARTGNDQFPSRHPPVRPSAFACEDDEGTLAGVRPRTRCAVKTSPQCGGSGPTLDGNPVGASTQNELELEW